MRARRVLLTHFSQRYPKTAAMGDKSLAVVAEAEAQDGGRGMRVLFAYDGMRVRLGEFWKAELFMPAMQALFEDEK
jgi:ribonuclease Z